MTPKNTIPVITIDGPSGSGKGTVAQMLAQKLTWHLLDSGALYRALAFAAQKHQIPYKDTVSLIRLALDLQVDFKTSRIGHFPGIFLENEEISIDIRSEKCGNLASIVSAIPEVREALLKRQRDFLRLPGLIADGRDMGTVVFPQAQLKIYLDATPEERAKRRVLQLKKQGIDASLAAILSDLKARDERDKNRTVAPLKPADDAVVIDSSHLDAASVTQLILEKAQNRFRLTQDGN